MYFPIFDMNANSGAKSKIPIRICGKDTMPVATGTPLGSMDRPKSLKMKIISMNANSGAKSKIPIGISGKEIATVATRTSPRNVNPPKSLKMEGSNDNLNPAKEEKYAKNKICSEGQQTKRNIQNATLKEKDACIEKNPKHIPSSRNVAPLKIQTLSKEIVNLLKNGKSPESKSSTKSDDNEVNTISNNRDKSPNTGILNVKEKLKGRKEVSPSLMVQPKKYCPHSGMMLLPSVAKSRNSIKAFNFYSNPSNLRRRSRSEYDFGFARNKPSTLKSKTNEEKNKTSQKPDVAKSSILSKNEKMSTQKENKICKEPSVPSKKSPAYLRMSQRLPLGNKSAKPLNSQSKTLKRSKTIHVFDSVPIFKKSGAEKEMFNSKSTEVKDKPEKPTTPKNNLNLPLLEEEIHVTPKKQVPHAGISFMIHPSKKGNEKVFS